MKHNTIVLMCTVFEKSWTIMSITFYLTFGITVSITN